MEHRKILEMLGQVFIEQNIDLIRPYMHSKITYYTDGRCGEVISTGEKDARLGWNPELFELLVKAGANVNCFSDEEYSSLLSWVIFDQWYEEGEGSGGGEPLAKIVEIMNQYGAKPTDDCTAEKPERDIIREHGMVTMGGLLPIEKVPGVGDELIHDFNEWLKSSHQEWMKDKVEPGKYDWRWKKPPDLAQLIQHKEKGLVLAKQSKKAWWARKFQLTIILLTPIALGAFVRLWGI